MHGKKIELTFLLWSKRIIKLEEAIV